MSLKDFRDDWETWSKGKKIASIIVGCCVLTFVFSLIFGLLAPDFNGGDYYESYDNSSDSAYEGSFKVDAENISVVSSTLDITNQETESTEYAYFYQNGGYAEPAYITYTAKDFYIQLDMNNLTLSDDSVLEVSDLMDTSTYNKSQLMDDISKLVNSDDASIKIECYNENDTYECSYENGPYYDFDVSMDNGILTLKYSNSSTSSYHTSRGNYSSNLDMDHARLKITGLINGTNSSKEIDFNLVSADMPVTVHT